METLVSTSSIAEEIQLSFAPVFLLAAIGGLLNVLGTHLSRAVDQLKSDEDWDAGCARDVRRIHYIMWSSRLCVMTAILVCIVVILIFLGDHVEPDLTAYISFSFIAAMALAFRAPFDLPTAPGVLAGGVDAEYTGVRLAVLRLGRMVLVVTLAAATTVFYLGGWHGPLLPPWAWSLIKTLAVAAAMLLAGSYLPRIREADLLSWCWKLGIPLALLNIFLVGVLILVVP